MSGGHTTSNFPDNVNWTSGWTDASDTVCDDMPSSSSDMSQVLAKFGLGSANVGKQSLSPQPPPPGESDAEQYGDGGGGGEMSLTEMLNSRSASQVLAGQNKADVETNTARVAHALVNGHSNRVLVGTEYILCVRHDNTADDYFVCVLCSRQMFTEDATLSHLECAAHRMTYLDRFFPVAFTRLGSGLNSPVQPWTAATFEQLNELCRRFIQARFGRLPPVVVSHAEFADDPLQLRRRVDDGMHFRETGSWEYVQSMPDPFTGQPLADSEKPPLNVGLLVIMTQHGIEVRAARRSHCLAAVSKTAASQESGSAAKEGDNGSDEDEIKFEPESDMADSTNTASNSKKSPMKSRYYAAATEKVRKSGADVSDDDSDIDEVIEVKNTRTARKRSPTPVRRRQGYRDSNSRSVDDSGRRRFYSPAPSFDKRERSRRSSPDSRWSRHRRDRESSFSDAYGYHREEVHHRSGRQSPGRHHHHRSGYQIVRTTSASSGSDCDVSSRGRAEPHSSTSRYSDSFSNRMRKFKQLERTLLDRLEGRKAVFDRRPEDHPEYSKEWGKFWEFRYKEVEKMGLNADTYDYIPEWKAYWEDLVEELFIRERHERRIELLQQYGFEEIEGVIKDTTTPPTQSVHHSAKSSIGDEKRSLSDDRITSSTKCEADIIACNPSPPPSVDVAFKQSDSRSAGAFNESFAKPIEESICLSSVLSTLTALEDQLGSFANATNSLMTRALIAERHSSGSSSELLMMTEHAVLLETLRGKLLGQISAGILDAKKTTATRKVVDQMTILLQSVPQHVFAPKLTVEEIVERLSNCVDVSADSLQLSRRIAIGLCHCGQRNISDETLTTVLKDMLKSRIETREPSPPLSTNDQLPSVDPVEASTPEVPMFNAYADETSQSPSKTSNALNLLQSSYSADEKDPVAVRLAPQDSYNEDIQLIDSTHDEHTSSQDLRFDLSSFSNAYTTNSSQICNVIQEKSEEERGDLMSGHSRVMNSQSNPRLSLNSENYQPDSREFTTLLSHHKQHTFTSRAGDFNGGKLESIASNESKNVYRAKVPVATSSDTNANVSVGRSTIGGTTVNARHVKSAPSVSRFSSTSRVNNTSDIHDTESMNPPAPEDDNEMSAVQIHSSLMRFDSLSRPEQENLMTYLKRLEEEQSYKVDQLKTLLLRKPIKAGLGCRSDDQKTTSKNHGEETISQSQSSTKVRINNDPVETVVDSSHSVSEKSSSVCFSKEAQVSTSTYHRRPPNQAEGSDPSKSVQSKPNPSQICPIDLGKISKEAIETALLLAKKFQDGSLIQPKGGSSQSTSVQHSNTGERTVSAVPNYAQREHSSETTYSHVTTAASSHLPPSRDSRELFQNQPVSDDMDIDEEDGTEPLPRQTLYDDSHNDAYQRYSNYSDGNVKPDLEEEYDMSGDYELYASRYMDSNISHYDDQEQQHHERLTEQEYEVRGQDSGEHYEQHNEEGNRLHQGGHDEHYEEEYDQGYENYEQQYSQEMHHAEPSEYHRAPPVSQRFMHRPRLCRPMMQHHTMPGVHQQAAGSQHPIRAPRFNTCPPRPSYTAPHRPRAPHGRPWPR